MLNRPDSATLNHLLTQSGWALQRLAVFSGKTARFEIAPFSFAYTIQKDGTLQAASGEARADAHCVIAPSLLPRLAMQNQNAYAEIISSGDAALLSEIFYLSRHLRWDMAEDLSRITGDIAAQRLVQLAKTGQQRIRHALLNLSQAVTEYWTEEASLLAKPTQLDAFARQVDALRDDAARLAQRINRLEPKDRF